MFHYEKNKNITMLQDAMPVLPRKKRVAAYARVSVHSEALEHSLQSQVDYYSDLIRSNQKWQFAGIYADDGVTGTSKKRPEFQRLLEDCRLGKIDMIFTKSISRFARNTVDLLVTIRRLREIAVDVWFERENIHSLSSNGEVLVTMLASFAEEEIRSISDNTKWRIRKKFEQGIPCSHFRTLGYAWKKERMVMIPEEAMIVRQIFQSFLEGKSYVEIKKELEIAGARTVRGFPFCNSSIRTVLTNITYTGNLLLQKTFIEDPIYKVKKYNEGQLPRFFVENTHEAIIDMDTFQQVQEEVAYRRKQKIYVNQSLHLTWLTGRVRCGVCGGNYERSTRRCGKNGEGEYTFWICRNKRKKGVQFCDGKSVPEHILNNSATRVFSLSNLDVEFFSEQVENITVIGEELLEFHLKDGRVLQERWTSTARRDWWSEERRQQFSRQCKGKNQNPATQNPFTAHICCPYCGKYEYRQLRHYKDGTSAAFWFCGTKGCLNHAKIWEDTIKAMVCEVFYLTSFREEIFQKYVSHIDVVDEHTVEIFYTDGYREYKYFEKKRKPRTITAKEEINK